jgi:hypothetical protein
MDSHWMDEQELSHTWPNISASAETSEQEDILDWLKSVGMGAALGGGLGTAVTPLIAATPLLPAAPFAPIVGSLLGGGVGALLQAIQPQAGSQSQPPSAPPVVAPATPASPTTSVPPVSGSKDGILPLQQFTQLLPELMQLIQSIQPIVSAALPIISSAARQSGGAAPGEDAPTDQQTLPHGDETHFNEFPRSETNMPFVGEWTSEAESVQPSFRWVE